MTRSLRVGGRTLLRGSARHRPSPQAQPQGVCRPGVPVTKSPGTRGKEAWEKEKKSTHFIFPSEDYSCSLPGENPS